MKRIAMPIATVVLLGSLAACGSSSSYEYEGDRDDWSVEVEDCDADDLLEGDEDCGFASSKKAKKNKSKKSPWSSTGKSRSSNGFKSSTTTRRR